LEGLAAFSVVAICGSFDQSTFHRNNAVALSRSPLRVGTTQPA
jgi:hypothetical protein